MLGSIVLSARLYILPVLGRQGLQDNADLVAAAGSGCATVITAAIGRGRIAAACVIDNAIAPASNIANTLFLFIIFLLSFFRDLLSQRPFTLVYFTLACTLYQQSLLIFCWMKFKRDRITK